MRVSSLGQAVSLRANCSPRYLASERAYLDLLDEVVRFAVKSDVKPLEYKVAQWRIDACKEYNDAFGFPDVMCAGIRVVPD